MKDFLWADVTRITSVTRVRLHQWIELGYVTPSIQRAEGTGRRHIWSRPDLVKIILLKRLIDGGMHRKKAAEVVTDLNTEPLFRKNRPLAEIMQVCTKADKSIDVAITPIDASGPGNTFDYSRALQENLKNSESVININLTEIAQHIEKES